MSHGSYATSNCPSELLYAAKSPSRSWKSRLTPTLSNPQTCLMPATSERFSYKNEAFLSIPNSPVRRPRREKHCNDSRGNRKFMLLSSLTVGRRNRASSSLIVSMWLTIASMGNGGKLCSLGGLTSRRGQPRNPNPVVFRPLMWYWHRQH